MSEPVTVSDVLPLLNGAQLKKLNALYGLTVNGKSKKEDLVQQLLDVNVNMNVMANSLELDMSKLEKKVLKLRKSAEPKA